MASIHHFKVEGISGEEINFADFSGKKLLIVNVASECGYTVQYQQLQQLFEEFKDKLVIIGFPSNDFGKQEPGSNAEILAFCTQKFAVTFKMAAKVSIIGPPIHPIYRWLTQKEQNGVLDTEVLWNFHKFLIDEDGRLVHSFPSSILPNQEEIVDWVNS